MSTFLARRQSRSHSATFKAQVAGVTLRVDKTNAENSVKLEVHSNLVTAWKAQLLECSSESCGEKADVTPTPNIEKLEAKKKVDPHKLVTLNGRKEPNINKIAA